MPHQNDQLVHTITSGGLTVHTTTSTGQASPHCNSRKDWLAHIITEDGSAIKKKRKHTNVICALSDTGIFLREEKPRKLVSPAVHLSSTDNRRAAMEKQDRAEAKSVVSWGDSARLAHLKPSVFPHH